MDSVGVPLCPEDESVDDALGELRAKNRSGIVVQSAGGYRLLHVGNLLYARARGLGTLADIDGGQPVILLQAHHIKEFQLDIINPGNTWQQYETFLRGVAHRYTLLNTTGNTAMLVTASEKDALTLTLTGGYQCDGTPTHYFPEPRVIDGEDCPKWPECMGPGGRKSKIHPAP
jgi:CBS domain-containing protein